MEYFTKIVRDPRDIAEIDRLHLVIREMQSEINKLHIKASWPKRTSPDDVLVKRIRSLNESLSEERTAHQKDVEELEYQIKVLRNTIREQNLRRTASSSRSEQIADDHIDILASIVCLYPFTPVSDLKYEFGLSAERIKQIASVMGSIKSPEARQQARDYLARQGRILPERRGGNQGNYPQSIPVEQVAKNGRVIDTFESINTASLVTGMAIQTIRHYCDSTKRRYSSEGYTFRYKKK